MCWTIVDSKDSIKCATCKKWTCTVCFDLLVRKICPQCRASFAGTSTADTPHSAVELEDAFQALFVTQRQSVPWEAIARSAATQGTRWEEERCRYFRAANELHGIATEFSKLEAELRRTVRQQQSQGQPRLEINGRIFDVLALYEDIIEKVANLRQNLVDLAISRGERHLAANLPNYYSPSNPLCLRLLENEFDVIAM